MPTTAKIISISGETTENPAQRFYMTDRIIASTRYRMILHAILGFTLGYLILHPVSMVIFHRLGPSLLASLFGESVLNPIVMSFGSEMIPMGLVFGLLGAFISVAYAYHHAAISIQRDNLAEQLELNERYRAALERQSGLLRNQNRKLVKLEKANRQSTQFMVHDFKTHLGCILGFSELLLDRRSSSLDAEAQTALRRIRRQALQMMGAVGDLLDLARLQNPRRLRKEKLQVGDLLREAVEDFSLPVHTKQIKLGPRCVDGPPVWGEFKLLKRVLTNAISNALKHNHPAVSVTLDAEPRRQRNEVLFSCSDNGSGIPPDVLPRLFENFSMSASESKDSSGLGLSFCKAAVEAHGGRIWCESTVGSGTCFYFTIPIDNKEEKNDQDKKARAHCGR